MTQLLIQALDKLEAGDLAGAERIAQDVRCLAFDEMVVTNTAEDGVTDAMAATVRALEDWVETR